MHANNNAIVKPELVQLKRIKRRLKILLREKKQNKTQIKRENMQPNSLIKHYFSHRTELKRLKMKKNIEVHRSS